jgi:hypothetical protein
MVQNSEWGPPLWRILHTLAERVGRQGIPLLAMDEIRAWASLLRTTEGIMPCPLCRTHYRAWKHTHPLEESAGSALAPLTRRWLWELHDQVNRQRGVEGGGVPFDELTTVYAGRGSAELQQDIDTLLKVLQRATQAGQLDGIHIRQWRASLSLVRRLAGI